MKKEPEFLPSPFLTKPDLPDEELLISLCSWLGVVAVSLGRQPG